MTIFRYNDLLYRGTNIVCNELLSCSEFGRILNKRKIKFSFFHSFGFFSFFYLCIYLMKLPIYFRDVFLFYDKNEYHDLDIIYRWLIFLLTYRWFIRVTHFSRFKKNFKKRKKYIFLSHPFLCFNYSFFRKHLHLIPRFFYGSFSRYWFKILRKILFPFFKIAAYNNITLLPPPNKNRSKRRNVWRSYNKKRITF